jgi:hypothetical protein
MHWGNIRTVILDQNHGTHICILYISCRLLRDYFVVYQFPCIFVVYFDLFLLIKENYYNDWEFLHFRHNRIIHAFSGKVRSLLEISTSKKQGCKQLYKNVCVIEVIYCYSSSLF